MIYEFRAADGEPHEEFFSMGTAPEIGKRIRRNGKWFRRVPSRPQARCRQSTQFVSQSLPDNWPYADRFGPDPDTGEMTRPAFNSRQEVNDAVARANEHGEEITYDY